MSKICNVCGTQFTGTEEHPDSCPACLDTGRGDIRDFHYAPVQPGEDVEPQPEEETADDGESKEDTGGAEIPDSDNDPDVEDPGLPDEPLDSMSRAHLSELAGERGLATSGTRADLIARLQAHAQG